jgi:hypothetical protein
MAFPENIDLRLGYLGTLIADAIAKTGQTPSRFVRDAIAEKLGVNAPEMDGHVKNLRQYQAKPIES